MENTTLSAAKFPGVRDLLKRIVNGELTATAATAACLETIAAREGDVQAWAFLDPERALAEAGARDRATTKGPLHGLPVAIKDVMDTADMPTAYGSPIYDGYRPGADAACVAQLRAAGAVILGKTVTVEFAMLTPSRTRNPHNLAHTPGGSSSGSAAAVACGMTPAALGTQTGGSIIRPAAYCGVVGFKPSFGAINRAGTKLIVDSLDTLGLFARSVADIPPLLAAFNGAALETYDQVATPPLRVGLFRGPDWDKAAPDSIAAFEAAAKRLEAAGASLRDVAIAPELTAANAAARTIVGYELVRSLAYEWFNHRERLSPGLADFIRKGWTVTLADYIAAKEKAEAGRRVFAGAFADTDIWLTLPTTGEAPTLETTGESVFNRLWTLLHGPAITLPFGTGHNGLPLGVQLIGAPRGAARLLACARWVETVLR